MKAKATVEVSDIRKAKLKAQERILSTAARRLDKISSSTKARISDKDILPWSDKMDREYQLARDLSIAEVAKSERFVEGISFASFVLKDAKRVVGEKLAQLAA